MNETIKERGIPFSGEMVRAIPDGRKTQTRRIIKPQPDYSRLKPYVILKAHRCPELGPVHLGRRQWGLYVEPYNARDVPYVAYNCPYGVPGDRLWVREAFAYVRENKLGPHRQPCPSHLYRRTALPQWPEPHDRRIIWKADGAFLFRDGTDVKWKPSIHMPRWGSRILLEITDIRVERVQEIGIYDVAAEGVDCTGLIEGFEIEADGRADGNEYDAPDDFVQIAKEKFATLWDSLNAKRGYGWDANPWVWVIAFKQIVNVND
ncbi:hypothetical protein LCGC14_0298000 [marine sediment metagenome]|uniref:ASCH domain-containing protein n=1 Tax=marine sediment metagenome TaxID=412755 RepID=A0A0F9WCK5_9ZZZZ